MIHYLDTSLLVPLHIHEPKSSSVRAWLIGLGVAELAVSEWCITEFASASSIKTRAGQIDQAKKDLAQAEFLAFASQFIQTYSIYHSKARLNWKIPERQLFQNFRAKRVLS